MTDLVEQLRAQSIRLREPACTICPPEAGHGDDPRDRFLADLIDGMLELHPPCDCRACERQGAPTGCSRCRDLYEACGTGTFYPCASLTLLARHVSSVLGEVTA